MSSHGYHYNGYHGYHYCMAELLLTISSQPDEILLPRSIHVNKNVLHLWTYSYFIAIGQILDI